MQALPTRDPLQPTADSALNSRSSTPSASRKRSRDEHETPITFTARSIDTKAKTSTAIFTPLVLVPRSHIPLVWLAPASSYKTLASPYLFEAHLSQIWHHDGCVLVARLSPNGGLYAIEKASRKSWVACRLSSWVTEEHCRDAVNGLVKLLDQDASAPGRSTHARSDSQSTTTSGRPLTPCSPKRPKNRRGALARMSILSSRESEEHIHAFTKESSALVDSPQLATSRFDTSAISQSQIDVLESLPPFEDHVESLPTADETAEDTLEPSMPSVEIQIPESPRHVHLSLEHVVQQYLDTLYLSRTSLAFFAKGPLSRARAQAKSGGAGLDLEGLADVYRACIMPAKKCDLKYKDSLPCAIKGLISNAATGVESRPKKKRASKQVKLGKNGLYSCENSIIDIWWHGREVRSIATPVAEAADAELRKAVLDLRTRETQMQLLLILEVMAIELMVTKEKTTFAETAANIVKIESVDQDFSKILAKIPNMKKKPRDLQSELDAIVDKLCIWHSVSLDGLLSSPDKLSGGEETTAKSKDRLKDFCAEVIKAFYGAKLPEQTKALCRKLGGTEISPQRPRPTSSKSSSNVKLAQNARPRPRSATKRPLERVLSEDKILRHASPPVLSRSSTVPDLKYEQSRRGIQREPSEVAPRPMSRSSMQKSVSFMGREIDLVAEARVHEAKKRKLDKINTQQEELRAAIEALKKPNRGSAAKEIMDEVEQRRSIQITATPGRRKVARLLTTGHKLLGLDDEEVPAEESDPIVPSSMAKTALTPNMARSSTKKRAVLAAISDTPSRGLARVSNPMQLPTWTAPLGDSIAATPATSRLRPDMRQPSTETPIPKMKKSGRTVLFTPVKRTEVDVQDVFKDAPIIPEDAGKAMDRVMGGKGAGEEISLDASGSIYDQLGWDNDDTDLG